MPENLSVFLDLEDSDVRDELRKFNERLTLLETRVEDLVKRLTEVENSED